MPLYPRTLSYNPGGISLRYLPNPAINVALTAGLFSLQPAVRLYTPYDQVSSYALKRVGVLAFVGGVIKIALSTYSDIVILESPLDPVLASNAAFVGDFVVVGGGSGAGLPAGTPVGVGEARENISGDIDCFISNISSNVSSGYLGPLLDFSTEISEFGREGISDTSLDNPLSLGFAYISKEQSISLNFATIVTQGKCLQGSAVDLSTAEGAGVIFCGDIPNASRVVEFTQSTSTYIYYNGNILDRNPTSASHSSLTLWNEDGVANRHNFVDWQMPLAFLVLITILGLTLKPRRVALKPRVSAHIRRHIPKGPIPQWYILEEEKLKGLKHRLEYIDGFNYDQYTEVWYSEKTMGAVNKFVANGCKFLPAQLSAEYRPFGLRNMRIFLHFMSLMEYVWLACKYLGRNSIVQKLEEICAKLPFHDNPLRLAVNVKGRKRRRRGRRNKLGVQDHLATRPDGAYVLWVSDGSVGESLARNANDGIGDLLDYDSWILGLFRNQGAERLTNFLLLSFVGRWNYLTR